MSKNFLDPFSASSIWSTWSDKHAPGYPRGSTLPQFSWCLFIDSINLLCHFLSCLRKHPRHCKTGNTYMSLLTATDADVTNYRYPTICPTLPPLGTTRLPGGSRKISVLIYCNGPWKFIWSVEFISSTDKLNLSCDENGIQAVIVGGSEPWYHPGLNIIALARRVQQAAYVVLSMSKISTFFFW